MHKMTTEENDPERFTCKRKEGTQANANNNNKNVGIIILVIDKAFFCFIPVLFCF